MRRRRRDHRRQRGMQLPAAAALCLAASLLVFAHAGGEQTAESVLAALASSPGFVSQAGAFSWDNAEKKPIPTSPIPRNSIPLQKP